jgi:filamentous hemagglutinin family protein
MKTTNKSLFSFTIFLAILGCFTSTQIAKVQAQVITPDNTLGNENSVVNTVGNRDTINGGALRGANLFHSFQEFGISGGREAYFANPAGIQNILSRVTGGNPSNILGKLGVLGGNANLFLINPSGIFFGPGASLDVGGSFFASTADSLVFGNGFEFSASNTLAPPLLTVNTPIGLRFRDNPGNITNQSVVEDNTGFPVGLQVKQGNSLALLGGDVSVEQGGRLTATGGRIELGGLAETGTVGLDVTGNTFKLNFPANSLFSNVSLADDALATVRGNGGGDIAVNANIFIATNGGQLRGGIEGEATKNGGDITVNSTIIFFDGVSNNGFTSGIFSNVMENSIGNAGSVNISTKNLFLSNGAKINGVTFGRGNAGTVKIQATDIFLSGVGINGLSSGIFSSVEGIALGNAGGIDITTRTLSLENGAAISASTFSRGNAGSVKIQANDISFDGVGSNRFSSGIFSTVQGNAVGKAGGIDITTGKLSLTNGAVINASTFATGDAGRIKIQASDTVFADGVGSNGFASTIRSDIEKNANGNAGGIDISTQSLSFSNGAKISASTFGNGNAGSVKIQANDISFDRVSSDGFTPGIFSSVEGNAVGDAGGIDIKTGTLSLKNGGVISVGTFNRGNAGNVKIQASDIFLNGVGSTGFSSGIYSSVTDKGIGNAGDIDIITKNLSVTDGAAISAITFGIGNAGSVKIKANNISFDGVGSTGFSSGIYSTVQGNAVGNAGGIDITTGKLSLTNGAIINASTFATGDAGRIKIQASDTIFASGVGTNNTASSIRNDVGQKATGNAGGIDISTKDLSFSNGARISASTLGNGNAGTVKIQANDISFDGSGSDEISSGIYSTVEESAVGNAGGININTGKLSLTNGALMTVSTFARGDAGGINIQASDTVFASGLGSNGKPSGIQNGVGQNAIGNAGGIDISTQNLFFSDGAQIIASTFGRGNAGSVKIQATDISFEGVGSTGFYTGISSSVEGNAIGNAGGIDIKTGTLSLVNGAQIGASTFNRGNAGSVKIQANDISLNGVGSTGFSSGIFSAVAEKGIGNAGGIDIKTKTLSLVSGAQIGASTFNRGNAGSVKIQANDISLNGVGSNGFPSGIFSAVAGKGIGNADGVDITTGKLSLVNGAVISASTFGTGDAGRIKIQASDTIFALGVGNQTGSGIRSDVQENATGNAGGIDISTKNLFLSDGAQVTALTDGRGNAGNVKIQASDISIDGVGSNELPSGIASTVEQNALGNAGGIDIITRNLFIKNGAVVNASTFARGDAGKINIQASDTIFASGVGSAGFSSAIGSTVSQNAVGNAGGINIATGILSLQNGAIITASTFGRGNAGTVKVQARDISFDGVGSNGNFSGIFSNVQQSAIGNAGGIDIEAETLSLKNFAIINASTFGRGNAGGIVVRTDDAISLANSSQIRSGVEAGGEGNAGNIDIKGRSLTLTGASQIGAFVFRKTNDIRGGIGRAGNITINTTDFVNISGVGSITPSETVPFGFSSGIFASAERGTTATTDKAAGNISITTGDFRITDRAVVNAATSNTGNGGNININGSTFTADSGAQVITTTRNSGNAGDITLKITDRITIAGNDPNYKQRLEEASKFGDPTDIVNNQGAESGIFANTASGSTGNGGDIFIDPKVMVVRDGAGISGNSEGTGNAGNIEVFAGSLTLDNKGFITTQSLNDGEGGKITINADEFLLLRRNSGISTSASKDGSPGSGGDININTGVLAAFPRENSDITANSFGGRGGNINIKTRGVFGIQVRPQRTELSDITARSEKSPQLSGQITLTNDVNPSQALVELPENVTNRTDQIARNPCQEGIGNEYIETGRGGLPTNPNQPLSSGVARVDLVNLAPNTGNTTASNTSNLNNSTDKKIVPAQGWVTNEKGQVVLTAYDPTGAGVQRNQQNTAVCPSR